MTDKQNLDVNMDKTIYEIAVSQSRSSFESLYVLLSKAGTLELSFIVGLAVKDEADNIGIVPAMSTVSVFKDSLHYANGVAFMTLNISPKACKSWGYESELQAFYFDVKINGTPERVWVPVAVMNNVHLREDPTTYGFISPFPVGYFFEFTDNGEVIANCPYERFYTEHSDEVEVPKAKESNCKIIQFPAPSNLH